MNPRPISPSTGPRIIALWDEVDAAGLRTPHYAISYDGFAFDEPRATAYGLGLAGLIGDPLTRNETFATELLADAATNVYVVQFVTHLLPEYQDALTAAGATIHNFINNHAFTVAMSSQVKSVVERLPFVRFVGPYHPGYRLEPYLRDNFAQLQTLLPTQEYIIQLFESGLEAKQIVAARIAGIGGSVDPLPPSGWNFYATLTPAQLLAVVKWDEVAWVDRKASASVDMNVARGGEISGAALVTAAGAYDGSGVRGEVMDAYFYPGHTAFQSIPPILHEDLYANDPIAHGQHVYGTIFGDGTGVDPLYSGAMGIIPGAQGIMAHWCHLYEVDCGYQNFYVTWRRVWIAELVAPTSPYKAVFQSNSWGAWPEVVDYNAYSADIDDILLNYDLLMCQSQGNCGAGGCSYCYDPTRCSRAQGWAKNNVSLGGVWHFDTATKDDDRWKVEGSPAASTGPASDGRVKPDLANLADMVYTTAGYSTYFATFGGTSAATPISCGQFGLFFQMWADDADANGLNIFGKPVSVSGCNPHCAPSDPTCRANAEACVFSNRTHAATAKAVMINTASQYCFNDPACPLDYDFTRMNQGWGMASAGRLYLLRNNFPLIIDESVVLDLASLTPNLSYHQTTFEVPANAFGLRATMVYTDPQGNPADQTRHVVNNLNLRLNAPDGVPVYRGNRGLYEGMWSVSGGQADRPYVAQPTVQVIDNVENVFVQAPDPGTWTVRVDLAELNKADAHLETGLYDVDFALVVSIDMDCNGNTASDADDILTGVSQDCDTDGVPEECETVRGACCVGQTCVANQTPCLCTGQGGVYQGNGTSCGPTSCGG